MLSKLTTWLLGIIGVLAGLLCLSRSKTKAVEQELEVAKFNYECKDIEVKGHETKESIKNTIGTASSADDITDRLQQYYRD